MATYQLRPLSTGEILDGALTLFRRHLGLLFGLAVVCQGVPAALGVYVDLAGGAVQHPGLSLLIRLLDAFGSLLVAGATMRVVSEAYLGRTPQLGEALRFAWSRLGSVFGASLAAGLVTVLATLALIIPGIVVACGYSVAQEVAALEPGAASNALARSWALTKGFRLKALVLWALSLALVVVCVGGLAVLGGAATALSSALETPATILPAALLLLLYPLITCVFTLFYYDLRVRKEGFDLEVLGQQLGIAAPP
ncbi:MAG TPA: hypothetical protein VH116_05645 [Gemmatimonadales bacterium]|jgi:hypothetical protein|nr:hypothetical protein [Gemmatimonadales bacterium]